MPMPCSRCGIWFDSSMLNRFGICARCRSEAWHAAIWNTLILFATFWLVAGIVSGCGGLPGAQQDGPGARAWCCETEAPDGSTVLECGVRERDDAHTCICAGTQILTLCMDGSEWEPGTACTRSPLICYEAKR